MKRKRKTQIKALESVWHDKKEISPSFLSFLFQYENKRLLYISLGIGIIYFIWLRTLYPRPIYFPDSFTYIEAARDHQVISFRPVQYSQLINFFKTISQSDVALIAAQYFSNLLANLFLFFTLCYFFSFRSINKILIFLLLIANPLYLFYSNFVLADPFFSSFTVAWFTLILWMIYSPAWYNIVAQLILLLLLFELRYNAIIYPVFTVAALFFSNLAVWRRLLIIALNFLLISVLILNVTDKTEELTGTRTFSAFGGWQLANNAIFVLKHEKDIDTAQIEDPDIKEALSYTVRYLDTARLTIDTVNLHGDYMWNKSSPLKRYIDLYARKYFYTDYFSAWTALGPVYNSMGRIVISQKPLGYVKYFIIPNVRNYLLPPFEVYERYMNDTDTLPSVVRNYYSYSINKPVPAHPWIFKIIVHPWYYLFALLNIGFIALLIVYLLLGKYKSESMFNKAVVCYILFFLANVGFIVLFAPSVFRYHLFIITLTIPLSFYLAQQCIKPLGYAANEIPG